MAALTAVGSATSVLVCASVASAETATNHVRDVRVHPSDGGGAEIEIVGTGAPTYNVRVADGGRRLLVDLSDSDLAGAPAAITTPMGLVGGVLTQSYETPVGHMTRLSISLAQSATYRVVPQGTSLRVLLTASGPARPASATAPAATALPQPSTPSAMIKDVRFERASPTAGGCAPNGCDRVVVDLGGIPAYSLSVSAAGKPRLELRSTALPESFARTLDVSAFGGALKTITASRDEKAGTAILELDRTSEVPGTLSVEGGTLVWSFPVPKPTSQPSPIAQLHIDGRAVGKDGGAVRHVVTVAREPEARDLPRIETSIHDEDPQVETAGGGAAGFTSTAGGNVLAQARY
ncbi:MAG TPA: AMIN domain-containing protein, partial [Polyangiaceae bacterium]